MTAPAFLRWLFDADGNGTIKEDKLPLQHAVIADIDEIIANGDLDPDPDEPDDDDDDEEEP